MARLSERHPRNAPGDLFVDRSCIACDTCRRIAGASFGGGEDDVAFVARQPTNSAERHRAAMALVACPVAAIGTTLPDRAGVAAASRAFPDPLAGADGVFACGYASPHSFGAASWLAVRDGGSVLVDSPRFAGILASRIEALGGATLLFLTHRDDVADHAAWAHRLGCARVLHTRDVTADTVSVEQPLAGDDPVELAADLLAIPVPGHTPGSMALLWRETFLFTGDHLWGDGEGHLGCSREVCWWSWDAQMESMERLLSHRFEWVLPGHGRPWRASSPAGARESIARLVRDMRRGWW